jgi:hypothetical protein
MFMAQCRTRRFLRLFTITVWCGELDTTKSLGTRGVDEDRTNPEKTISFDRILPDRWQRMFFSEVAYITV